MRSATVPLNLTKGMEVEAKLNRAIYCLYAAAAVQVVSLVFSALSTFEMNSLGSPGAVFAAGPTAFLHFSLLWPLAVLGTIAFVTRALKTENEWAWVGALSVFVFTLPSYSLMFSVVGLLSLLDRDVRGVFLTKLDIKI